MALYGGLSLLLCEASVEGLILSSLAMSLSSTFLFVCSCSVIISFNLVRIVLNSFMVDSSMSLDHVFKMFQIVMFCVFIGKK